MSYRGFKRLLGESSLERKSRFLLGAVTLLLITGSFWLFARMTVGVAYDAINNAGRLLTTQLLYSFHVDKVTQGTLIEFQKQTEEKFADALSQYQFRLYKPHSRMAQYRPDADEREIIEELKNNPEKYEADRYEPGSEKYFYYGAIRVTKGCIDCHPLERERGELPSLKENMLYGVIRIQLDSRKLEEGVHLNRAILISNALVTSLLVMAGSYLIVRYVVVKPVKHLKEVSDQIANGYFNVRSEIQTGDEFEDLSYAFNRMIRNLMIKQEELSESKATLDAKVDELARANLALFESNRLKGEFLATMSHELRTPLHSILGFSDLLQQSDGLGEKQRRWATNIRTSGAHLLDLINDILDLARLEAGKMDLRHAEIDVADFIEEAVGHIRPLAEKKSLELRYAVAPDLPTAVQDKGKLQQVLSNLLSNAVKFTPEGGSITVDAAQDGDDLVIRVTDTGVGIAAADREAVFDKFRQGANPLTREYQGTGLGLSIVRELCKLMGGDVSLESEPGRGSTFIVRVPYRVASRAPAATAAG
jgi:signal transduction histidine kinase